MIKKLFKPICWLGFHYWDSYITTNDTIDDGHTKIRRTTRTCLICDRKQYKSDMIYEGNYYEDAWKWLK